MLELNLRARPAAGGRTRRRNPEAEGDRRTKCLESILEKMRSCFSFMRKSSVFIRRFCLPILIHLLVGARKV